MEAMTNCFQKFGECRSGYTHSPSTHGQIKKGEQERLVTRGSPLGPQSALWVMALHQGRDRDWPESPEAGGSGMAQAVGCTVTLGL